MKKLLLALLVFYSLITACFCNNSKEIQVNSDSLSAVMIDNQKRYEESINRANDRLEDYEFTLESISHQLNTSNYVFTILGIIFALIGILISIYINFILSKTKKSENAAEKLLNTVKSKAVEVENSLNTVNIVREEVLSN